MNIEITNKPKSTVELKITVPNKKVMEEYESVVAQLVKEAELDGFRKGKAPKDLVLEKSDPQKINGEVMNNLLQTYYPEALKQKHISPVSNPQVNIKGFDLEKDFEFTATVATKPEITLDPNYIEKIKKFYEEKRENIKKTNEEKLKKGEQLDDAGHIHLNTDEILEQLLLTSQLDVSDIVVEEETDRMMARLINQAQTIGMSLENYLKTQDKTAEQLRKEYRTIAESNAKIEFILAHLVKERAVQVSEDEIQRAIDNAGDENIRKQMDTPLQRFYIRNVLEKNKLLTDIIKEVEGENYHEHTH